MRTHRPSLLPLVAPGGTSLHRAIGVVTLLLLALSTVAVIRGWLHSDMGGKLGWWPDGIRRVALTSAVYWLAFGAVLASGRKAFAAKLLAAAAIPVAGVVGVVPLASAAGVLFAAASFGHGVLARARAGPPAPAQLPLAVALGCAVLGAVLAVLALFPVNSQLTYAVVLAVPMAWHGRALAASLGAALLAQRRDVGTIDLVGLGLVGNLALVHVAAALLPEVGADALTTHLTVASRLRDFGLWHYDVHQHTAAVFPMGGSLLYAASYMFGGEAAARLTNVATLFAALGVVYAAVRSIGSRTVAIVAVLVAASAPLALTASASLFIENPWALGIVAGLVLLERALREEDSAILVAAAIALGGALATKVIAIALVPVVALVLLAAARGRERRLPARAIGWAACAGLLVAAPPFAIAWWKTGNPVFPFFNSVFASPLFPARNAASVMFPPALEPLTLYRMTFYSDRFIEGAPGALGFATLWLLPALAVAGVAWGGRLGRIMLLALAALFVLVLSQMAYLRYVYPAGFMLAIALGAAVAGTPKAPGIVKGALATVGLLSAALGALFLPSAAGQMRDFPLAPLSDAQARAGFVTAWAPSRDLVAMLNAWPQRPGAVAYAGEMPVSAELRRAVYGDTGYTWRFRDRLHAATTDDALAALARDHDVGYFIVGVPARADLAALVDAIARPVASVGRVKLYEVDHIVRFPRAIVAAEGFVRGAGGAPWAEHGRVDVGPGQGVLVDASNFLYRGADIEGGREYRLAVTVRCAQGPAQVRLQVIWHDRERHENVEVATAPCSRSWTEEQRILRAPENATSAIVYVAGHDPRPVEVRDVSLRGR